MALNPYTLYNLYEKGILPYVPEDLMMGSPVAPMLTMSNPYLDMAQQGGLYQNYGMNNDTFQMNTQPSNPVQSGVQVGSMSPAGGMNTFLGTGIGAGSVNSPATQFGFNDTVGAYSQAGGMNIYNGVGIGGQTPAGGVNSFGGFAGVGNGIVDGYNKTASVINRTPKFILGLAAAAIAILGIKHAFKGGKAVKHAKTGSSFLSKLNPLNWSFFKKIK